MDENIETTLFSEVYAAFLNKITEDTYVYYTREEINDDAETMLIAAINQFEYPKVNIRDYNLEYPDMPHYSRGKFNVALALDEIEILATLMIIEWSKRKLADSSLLSLIYTGSDAKSLGTKAQISAIQSQLAFFKQEIKTLKHKYAVRRVNEDKSVEADTSGLVGTGANTLLVTRGRKDNGRLR